MQPKRDTMRPSKRWLNWYWFQQTRRMRCGRDCARLPPQPWGRSWIRHIQKTVIGENVDVEDDDDDDDDGDDDDNIADEDDDGDDDDGDDDDGDDGDDDDGEKKKMMMMMRWWWWWWWSWWWWWWWGWWWWWDDDDDDDDDDDADDDGERVMIMMVMVMLAMRMITRRMMEKRRKMMMLRRKTDPKTGTHTLCELAQSKRGHTFCASLCSRNARQDFTRNHFIRKFTGKMPRPKSAPQTLCGPAQLKRMSRFQKSHFLRKFTGKNPRPKTAPQTFCEPPQSKHMSRFHKSHFILKFTGKMPQTEWAPAAFTPTVRIPQCGHTVWGKTCEYTLGPWHEISLLLPLKAPMNRWIQRERLDAQKTTASNLRRCQGMCRRNPSSVAICHQGQQRMSRQLLLQGSLAPPFAMYVCNVM